MPLAEIGSVVHVSSEDSLHPARNLITSALGNNVKKWLSLKKGEKQIYVIFRLKEKATITNVTVGNENSGFIEILVANEDSDEKGYQVLLPATEIQTVQDTRAGRNKNAIHFFTTKDFNKDVTPREWSRVKVVCSQPYDPHTRFGLSCFVLKSIKDENAPDSKAKVEKVMKKDTSVSDDVKTDLNDWKESMLQRLGPGPSGVSSPKKVENGKRGESTSSCLLTNSVKEENDDEPCVPKNVTSPVRKTAKQVEKATPKAKKNTVREEKPKPTPPAPPPPAPKREFGKLLDDVRFTMSGYENPLRSQIRNKGLEMGAKYAGDWDSRCTHLVCAFLNTPKFTKVKGHGKIVTKDWIDQCYSKRRRLPWRRFALDPKDKKQPESEEDGDDDEDKGSVQKVDRRRRLPSNSSSSDSEDEVQRVIARKAAKLDPVVTGTNGLKRDRKKVMSLQDMYNAETDIEDDDNADDSDADPDFQVGGSQGSESDMDESQDVDMDASFENELDSFSGSDEDDDGEPSAKKRKTKKESAKKKKAGKPLPAGKKMEEKKKTGVGQNVTVKKNGKLIDDCKVVRPDTTNLPLPALPNIPPRTYYLAEDAKGEHRDNLTRYIHAFSGTICDKLSNDVEYAITDDPERANQIAQQYPDVVTVKSEWIWNCNDADQLLPTARYKF